MFWFAFRERLIGGSRWKGSRSTKFQVRRFVGDIPLQISHRNLEIVVPPGNRSANAKSLIPMDLPDVRPVEGAAEVVEDPPTVESIGDPVVEEAIEKDSSDHETDDDVELPSTVTDRRQIFMPLDLKPDDPRIYGKWMCFSNGNLSVQDQMWIRLATLILQGLVILQESSTAKNCRDRGRSQGVIKCYTRGDLATIKKVGMAIRDILDDGVILHYKSNKASKDSLRRSYGDRFISQYMLTDCGGFYEKDELDRWTKVKDGSGGKTSPMTWAEPKSQLIDGAEVPSREMFRRRYFYPDKGTTEVCDGLWTLFCGIGDSEMDRVWPQARGLVEEGALSFLSCETAAFRPGPRDNPLRRCISCVVPDYHDVARLLRSGDRLRERADYDFPMYFRVCRRDDEGRKIYTLKYLYTEDRELYEYVDERWQLIAKDGDRAIFRRWF